MNAAAACDLPALLQLASSALPIGGFGYSGGLESAIDAELVSDAGSAARWLDAMLALWRDGDARHWLRLHRAWINPDHAAFLEANRAALAMRETAELRLESTQTGRSMALWLLALAPPGLAPSQAAWLRELRPIAHVAAHAAACASLGLTPRSALHALGWSLLENLALAAVKLVPLGQDAGQRLLRDVALQLPVAVDAVLDQPDRAPSNFAPMLALLSSRHETQYSRLFRS